MEFGQVGYIVEVAPVLDREECKDRCVWRALSANTNVSMVSWSWQSGSRESLCFDVFQVKVRAISGRLWLPGITEGSRDRLMLVIVYSLRLLCKLSTMFLQEIPDIFYLYYLSHYILLSTLIPHVELAIHHADKTIKNYNCVRVERHEHASLFVNLPLWIKSWSDDVRYQF